MITEEQCVEFLQDGATLVDDLIPMDIIDIALKGMDKLYSGDRKSGIIGYAENDGLAQIYQCESLEIAAKAVLRAEEVEFISAATLHTLPSDAEEWIYDDAGLHVDIQYNRDELDSTPVKMSIMFMVFLDDVEKNCAPTVVSPGSHQLIADHLGSQVAFKESPTNIKDLPDLDFRDMIPVTGKKGQVSISTTSLLHGGSNNTTDHSRKLLFIAFAPKGLNLRFNINREQDRLEFLERLYDCFPENRKYIVESTIASLKANGH
ncbi:phytanoyl-CoA dioxygenase family protein [bacterium AH-315-E10]|nr:phytanoyl-CoA dioxygenase family protein [bacterium AH-315-E10]